MKKKREESSRRGSRRFEQGSGISKSVPPEAEALSPDSSAPIDGAGEIDAELTDEDELFGEGADHRRFKIRRDVRRRVDKYLIDRLKGISRNRIQKLIDLGGVKINDKIPKASTLILKDDVIDVILPAPAIRTIEPEPIPLHILYEDDHFIVVNKQAGLIVHPARSHLSGTLLNGLAYHFKQQREAKGQAFEAYRTTGFKRGRNGIVMREGVEQPRAPYSPPSKGGAARETYSPPSQGGAGGGSGQRETVTGPAQQRGGPVDPVQSLAEPEPQRELEGRPSPIPSLRGRGVEPPEPSESSASSEIPPGTLSAAPPGSREYDGPPVTVDGLSEVGSAECRPGIVHRLDKFTTGVMVVAKSDEAHWGIARQFEDRQTMKSYLAIVHGNFDTAVGVIDEPIGKHPTIREAFAVRRDSQGKQSVTIFRVREQYEGYALVELDLKTGRTHQIRVHLSYLGHPIIGDIIYGGEPIGKAELASPPTAAGSRKFLTFARTREDGQRLEAKASQRSDIILVTPALHAGMLSFTHPITRQVMRFTAPLHQPMLDLVRALRQRPAAGPVATEGTLIDLAATVPD